MDIKNKEAFEKAYAKTDHYYINYEKTNASNSAFSWNDQAVRYTWHDVNSAWEMWQAAKAQAVPEVKLSHCVTLTCAQLREAFMFGAPDGDDQEQLETEMTIAWSEDGHSGKGYYCYYSELPEEGAIFLDKVIEAQEQNQ